MINLNATWNSVTNVTCNVTSKVGTTWNAMFPPRSKQEMQQESESGTSRFFSGMLQVTLWLAFGAFLLASLPHVAYFFATFEPENNGTVSDYWWFVAYALALAIDVTSFLLSLNVAVKMRRATSGLYGLQKCGAALIVFATHWPFILLLVGFSWLVNFEHAKEFQSSMLSLAESTTISIFGWSATLQNINPVIASAFPVLAVAYTGMSDRISSERKSITPAVAQQAVQTVEEDTHTEIVVTEMEKMLQAMMIQMQTMNKQNIETMLQANNQMLQIGMKQISGTVVDALKSKEEDEPDVPQQQNNAPQQLHQTDTNTRQRAMKTYRVPAADAPDDELQRKIIEILANDPKAVTRSISEKIGDVSHTTISRRTIVVSEEEWNAMQRNTDALQQLQHDTDESVAV